VLQSIAKDAPVLVGAAIGLLAVIGLGEALRLTRRITPETSRQFIHAATGLFAAAVPFLFRHPESVYLLSSVFVLVNLTGMLRGWFPAMHGVRRRSTGTVTFPLALIVAVAACWSTDPGRLFAIPVAFLILAISDPLAAIVGTHKANPLCLSISKGEKTLAGSAAFFLSAFVISTMVLLGCKAAGLIEWTTGDIIVAALGVAAVTGAAEILSSGGWDNLFIVIAAIVFLVYFDEHPQSRYVLLGALGIGALFAWLTLRMRFLDMSGAIAGGLLAVTVVGIGGWGWAVPSFAFFVLSSLLSKLGGAHKASIEAQYEKGHVRDAGQVFANGGVGWIMLLAHTIWPDPVFYWAFLGAFAAAAADTWATEVGALSRARPRLITTFRKVPPGTSGAVSVWGLVGAVAGAVVVWMTTLPFPMAEQTGISSFPGGLAVIVGGLIASLVDSLAGATIQVQYVDPQTGNVTERPVIGAPAHIVTRGYRCIRNDQVNLLCTLCGAAFAAICFGLTF